MRIKVKSLQGNEYVVDVENEQSVSQLKSTISEKASGLATERIKLVYRGRTMQDTCSIGDYNLEEDCKVHLILQKDSAGPSTERSSDSKPCPMDVAAATSGGAASSDTSKSQKGFGSAFESILRKRLAEIFPPEQVDTIIANIHEEISDDINSSSLDDLERLAEQKLRISNE